jgi:hypothetical protein
MSSRFGVWRVRHAHRTSPGAVPQEACWLIAEWPLNEAAPTKFSFSNLLEGTSRRDLVRLAKRRWWVEHSYRELKDELGLDHFEGRSWRGWNHHVTLTMLAYSFLVETRLKLGKKGVAAWHCPEPANSFKDFCCATHTDVPTVSDASESRRQRTNAEQGLSWIRVELT